MDARPTGADIPTLLMSYRYAHVVSCSYRPDAYRLGFDSARGIGLADAALTLYPILVICSDLIDLSPVVMMAPCMASKTAIAHPVPYSSGLYRLQPNTIAVFPFESCILGLPDASIPWQLRASACTSDFDPNSGCWKDMLTGLPRLQRWTRSNNTDRQPLGASPPNECCLSTNEAQNQSIYC